MKTWSCIGLVLSLAACARPAGPPADPRGTWLAASGNVEVTIHACGASLCGDVSRVLANNSMEGPGPAKTPPATTGLRILSGLHSDAGAWTGRIFNREQGRSYDCRIATDGANRLVVHPYVALPLFGKTQVWRRAG